MNDDFKEELKDCYARIERQEAALRRILSEFGYTLPTGTKDMLRAVLEDVQSNGHDDGL
tara:strand:+ start:6528 stop:6704 length:177 start_codon:yes stop_codon:yes gene_type:complete